MKLYCCVCLEENAVQPLEALTVTPGGAICRHHLRPGRSSVRERCICDPERWRHDDVCPLS